MSSMYLCLTCDHYQTYQTGRPIVLRCEKCGSEDIWREPEADEGEEAG